MKVLSIQQPWAFAIIFLGKNIENRTWKTNFRGEFLIHAGLKYDKNGEIWIAEHFPKLYKTKFSRELCAMGGIVGKAKIIDCVAESKSPWFFGPYGFKLSNIEFTPFIRYKGQLGFFEYKRTEA